MQITFEQKAANQFYEYLRDMANFGSDVKLNSGRDGIERGMGTQYTGVVHLVRIEGEMFDPSTKPALVVRPEMVDSSGRRCLDAPLALPLYDQDGKPTIHSVHVY